MFQNIPSRGKRRVNTDSQRKEARRETLFIFRNLYYFGGNTSNLRSIEETDRWMNRWTDGRTEKWMDGPKDRWGVDG